MVFEFNVQVLMIDVSFHRIFYRRFFFTVDVFKEDPQFEENEEKYKMIKRGTPINLFCIFKPFW